MRFRGTIILLVICAGLGGYLYFYEYKGGEKREKAKQEESRLWKMESSTIQQIDLISPANRITAVRSGDKEWRITSPRELDADSDELNRIAGSAADMSRESVLESNAGDLSRFGLKPPQTALEFKTKDGKEYKINFGIKNPTGSSNYAAIPGKNEVLLVASYVAGTFDKKLDDLRNHSILPFDQSEAQSLDLHSSKGDVQLVKEGDRWWIQGKERWAADSSAVSGLLSSLSSGRLKDFFDENPEGYSNLGFDKPEVDVRLVVGKNRAIKHLIIGTEKAKLLKKGEKPKPEVAKKEDKDKKEQSSTTPTALYLAKDESRNDYFFVEKDLVDKLLKTPSDFRDKALAAFQRWDIDSMTLTNSKGTFTFSKSSGDWLLGDAKKKTKWDAVNGILDALEKPVKEFIDNPAALSTYGLDKPVAHVILKQGAAVKVDCIFGKEAKDGVYAQVKGEQSVKIADKESLTNLNKGDSDFIEPPPSPPTPAPKK
ncbi:MAG TPA: DUF4340 domain-containing protein [Acidobacteriota bacterium]|nr:DUF4340 domain-containing protein [Acidobacteriota bacterium]